MKRNIVIATVTAAALLGGGTATALAVTGDDGGRQTAVRGSGDDRDSGDKGDDAGSDDDGGRDDDGRDDAAPVVRSGDVTAADAIAAALRDTRGTAVSADLDDDDRRGGATVWDVDVLAGNGSWHSVRVDAGSGAVLGSHTEDEDDAGQVRAALKGTSVTAAEAARAAAAKGTVTSVDLDDDARSQGWEVETRTSAGKADQDWLVDLRTGNVTVDRSDD
ncbi:PepSY domain-containing protein [Streptomyces pseudovenezuelae]|uniref:Membrane protein YkoI n=1 Tax=Streptomyces pseudovenezuelae TaxID=67350 RepID=A0ABT6LUG4_9ACTN|nr:PepSY domain-containing protein [Streptomyces pseudovenezuelae]MDH6219853.1 putative membrane protein YkoI [Streptomyces pseudovenezuelae]